MNNNNGSMICALTCWGVALFAGVVATAMLMVLGGWMFIQGAFVGLLVFLVGGALMSWLLCRPLTPLDEVSAPTAREMAPAAATTAPAAAATPAAPAAAPAPAPEAHPSGPAVKPSPRLAGQEDLAARKGEWSYQGHDTSPSPTGAQDEAASTDSDGPEVLSAARDGKADNLKLLKGVGPKLEQTLNELGFYHFDQIAAWTDAHVAWVDERLKFKGRIERDGWIEQAKILAAGGETEFSKRNK
ncbi:MAG: endonuclease [Arenibacterium sp.]